MAKLLYKLNFACNLVKNFLNWELLILLILLILYTLEPLAKVKITIIYHLNMFHNLLLFSNIYFHRDPETSSG